MNINELHSKLEKSVCVFVLATTNYIAKGVFADLFFPKFSTNKFRFLHSREQLRGIRNGLVLVVEQRVVPDSFIELLHDVRLAEKIGRLEVIYESDIQKEPKNEESIFG